VEIDQDHGSRLAQPLNLGQDGMKRILQRRHERTALQVDDSDAVRPSLLKMTLPCLAWRADNSAAAQNGFMLQ